MKYYKGTYEECKVIVERMSSDYGYPNKEAKTNTLVAILADENEEYYFYVHDYWDSLTEQEKNSGKIYED
tara:strand:- start:253 stop:462 length:210 start_codon:yes stop_codon:yes gene_type:complete